MEKKLKKGGHCSNFTDYSTKIANNSRFKNHTDNSRNYAGIFRGGLAVSPEIEQGSCERSCRPVIAAGGK